MYYCEYSTDRGSTWSDGNLTSNLLMEVINYCKTEAANWKWYGTPLFRISYHNRTSHYRIGYYTTRWERCVHCLYNALEDELDKQRGWVCPLPERKLNFPIRKTDWKKACASQGLPVHHDYIGDAYRLVRKARIDRRLRK